MGQDAVVNGVRRRAEFAPMGWGRWWPIWRSAPSHGGRIPLEEMQRRCFGEKLTEVSWRMRHAVVRKQIWILGGWVDRPLWKRDVLSEIPVCVRSVRVVGRGLERLLAPSAELRCRKFNSFGLCQTLMILPILNLSPCRERSLNRPTGRTISRRSRTLTIGNRMSWCSGLLSVGAWWFETRNDDGRVESPISKLRSWPPMATL